MGSGVNSVFAVFLSWGIILRVKGGDKSIFAFIFRVIMLNVVNDNIKIINSWGHNYLETKYIIW